MSNIEKQAEARRLLALYYEGSTGPEEIAVLRKLLAESEPLPHDLAMERQLLDIMASAHEEMISAIEVPDGLEATLRMNLHRQAASERGASLLRRRRWLRWSGAAAVILGACVAYSVYERGGEPEEHPTYIAQMKEKTVAIQEAAKSSELTAQQKTPSALHNIVKPAQPSHKNADEAATSLQRHITGKTSENTLLVEERSASPEETIAQAIAEMREVSKDMFLAAREDMDIVSIEAATTLSDVQTAFLDDFYPSENYTDSETIMEP